MGALTQGDQSKIVQVVSSAIAAATGTTAIPDDNTAPLSTEGSQIASLSLTPKSASNKVRIRASFSVVLADGADADSNVGLIVAVFRGATFIGAKRLPEAESVGGDLSLEIEDEPASVAALTYSLRVGLVDTAGGTWYINRSQASATALASGLASNRFTAEEIRA